MRRLIQRILQPDAPRHTHPAEFSVSTSPHGYRSTPGSSPSTPHGTTGGKLAWGDGQGAACQAPESYLDLIDPIEGTTFSPGEQISVCTRCGTGYHLTTMSYLRANVGGVCVSCRQGNGFRTVTLSTGGTATAGPASVIIEPLRIDSVEAASPKVDPMPVDLAPIDDAGRPIIQLHQVRDHIGEDVAFEGRVLNVRLTGGGAHFLYFERAARVLDGFRAVIRPRDIFHWEIEGIDPSVDYPDQWVRVTGRIIDDPRWQLEMVIQRPEAIQCIPEPTVPAGWSSVGPAAMAHHPEPTEPDEPVAVTKAGSAPRPRLRWID